MSEPEIARRCLSCGASIRDAALFCPQCGIELPLQKVQSTSPLLAPTLEDTIFEAAPSVPNEPVEPARVESARVESPKETAPNDNKTRGEVGTPAVPVEPSGAPGGQSARVAVGGRLQRATTLARDVEGDVIHRARRVREISSVVLDEAAYDPSLRFVLVAALLFVVFLIIVLLNKFIT
jgi:hypothetical protein